MIASNLTSRQVHASLPPPPQKRDAFSVDRLPFSSLRQKNIYFSGSNSTSDQFGLPFRSNVHKLLNVDISGTFTETPDYFKEQFRDEENASLLNTGRSLEYLQPPGKLQELKLADAVVDFLSTDNGMTLYWNKGRLPMAKWIPHLTPESQVPKFKENMESTFNSTPQAIREDVLEPIGKEFKAKHPNLPISVKFKPEIKTKCTLIITGDRAKELHEEFQQLLKARLIALKVKADILKEDRNATAPGTEIKYTIAPDGYSKLSPIEFIINEICSQVEAVESYGNNMNDLEVASRSQILKRSHSSHIILGGCNTPSLRESLKDQDHITLWETIQDFLHGLHIRK